MLLERIPECVNSRLRDGSASGSAGVIDENVDRFFFHNPSRRLLHLFRLAEVGLDGAVALGMGQGGNGLLKAFCISREHDDACAESCQVLGGGETNALGRSANDGGFSIKLHGQPFMSFRGHGAKLATEPSIGVLLAKGLA